MHTSEFQDGGSAKMRRRFRPVYERTTSWVEEGIWPYLTFRDLFGNAAHRRNSEDLYKQHVREFASEDVLQVLAKLHWLCTNTYHKQESRDQLALLGQLTSGAVKKKLIGSWRSGRLLLTRQQLLASMKCIILWNTEQRKAQIRVEDDRDSFLRLLYRPTDFLEGDFRREQQQGRDDVRLAHLAIQQELNSVQHMSFVMLRYWILYTCCARVVRRKLPRQYYPLLQKFKELTGLDLKLYILLAASIWVHYHSLGKNPTDLSGFLIGPGLFAKLRPEVRSRADLIFQQISASSDEVRRQFETDHSEPRAFYYSFQPFWRKPLLNIRDREYFVLDMHYLGQRAGPGVYYEVNDALLERQKMVSDEEAATIEKERKSLMRFMGRLVEAYVHNLLTQVFGTESKRLFSEPGGDDTGGVDFIILYPEAAVFVEVTTRTVTHNTILGSKWSKIEREVKDILFGKDDSKSKGKIGQLDAAITRLRNGELGQLAYDPRKIKFVYPVLMMQKSVPCVLPHMETYRSWCTAKGLLPGCVDSFEIMDLEELEMTLPFLEKGETLVDILKDWVNHRKEYLSFRNYLIKSKAASVSNNSYLKVQLEQFSRDSLRILFGTK